MKYGPALLALAVALAPACGALKPRKPLPADLVEDARPIGMPADARYMFDPFQPEVADEVISSVAVEILEANAGLDSVQLLAISGGGSNGAFGAGLLCGWTERGDRPEFEVVTGISTGALIAPYAFLGSEYDDELKANYTTVGDADIFEERGIFHILEEREAIASTAPLRELLKAQLGPAKLEAVAREHARGRRLFVGTAQMDSERFCIWDMGAIAANGTELAYELFYDVLMASAAIPIAFPPVYIDVVAAGQKYDEMHCDGGVMAQVFGSSLISDMRSLAEQRDLESPRCELYYVRNAYLQPRWKGVQRSIEYIGARTISTLIKYQGYGDLYRAFYLAERTDMDFRLAYIPLDFDVEAKSEFDTAYMQALFERGRSWVTQPGDPWHRVPPGLEPVAADE